VACTTATGLQRHSALLNHKTSGYNGYDSLLAESSLSSHCRLSVLCLVTKSLLRTGALTAAQHQYIQPLISCDILPLWQELTAQSYGPNISYGSEYGGWRTRTKQEFDYVFYSSYCSLRCCAFQTFQLPTSPHCVPLGRKDL
jgi:hypothetical protein